MLFFDGVHCTLNIAVCNLQVHETQRWSVRQILRSRLTDQLLDLRMVVCCIYMCKSVWEDRQLHSGSGDIVQTVSDTKYRHTVICCIYARYQIYCFTLPLPAAELLAYIEKCSIEIAICNIRLHWTMYLCPMFHWTTLHCNMRLYYTLPCTLLHSAILHSMLLHCATV